MLLHPRTALMTPEEGLVMVAATILAAVVVLESAKDTLTPAVGVLLLTLAVLAALAELLHMLARLTR